MLSSLKIPVCLELEEDSTHQIEVVFVALDVGLVLDSFAVLDALDGVLVERL